MKRNESILVYSVTGLLVVILGVAIAFGDGGVQAGTTSDLKTFDQLAGIAPAGIGAQDPPAPAVADAAAQPASGGAGPAPAVEPSPAVPLDAGPAPAPVADDATRVLVLLGESARDGDYRVVTVRPGDTFSELVHRWCGSAEQTDVAAGLNEEFDLARLEPGVRLYLPWVDDAVLLASHERRKAGVTRGSAPAGPAAQPEAAAPAGAAPATGEPYVVKAGDKLWNLAVARVGAGKANQFIAAVQALNPELRANPNRLVAGKTIYLPR